MTYPSLRFECDHHGTYQNSQGFEFEASAIVFSAAVVAVTGLMLAVTVRGYGENEPRTLVSADFQPFPLSFPLAFPGADQPPTWFTESVFSMAGEE